MSTGPAPPRAVSRFEANLLRILSGFLQRAPVEQILPRLLTAHDRPQCLSRAAVELVQDALGKGCVRLLARGGGWRRERCWRGDRAVEGRLWERTPPEQLGLAFSRHALEFLIWITAAEAEDPYPAWQPPEEELTLGDRLLGYFAYDAVRGTKATPALRQQPPFAHDGLCRLAFPDDFADNSEGGRLDLAPWMAGAGPYLLEALQPRLAERWLEVERGKGQITDWRRMRRLGQSQGQVLEAFLAAVDGIGRRDLARFLLQTADQMLRGSPTAQAWVGRLSLQGVRLVDRTDVYRAALLVLRHLERLRQWDRQARTIGYFDEGYAAGQLWKAEWEHWDGEGLWARAQAVLRELEPFAAGGVAKEEP